MKTLKIDLGTKEYLQSLSIRREVFVVEQQIPEELEIDEHEEEAIYFLTCKQDVPAATGRLRVVGEKIKFERIATLKSFRGQGVASHLMQTMLAFAQKNFSKLTPYMRSQADAVKFYEKLGWKKVGAPFVEADIPHQAMSYPKEPRE